MPISNLPTDDNDDDGEYVFQSYTNWGDCYDDWTDETRPLHATIQTIMDIPIGETRNFLCLDPNAFEVLDSLKDYGAGDEGLPSDIFHENYHIKFTKTGEGLTGKFFIVEGVAELGFSSDSDERNDFDIEYVDKHWYPMENGILPANDSQGCVQLLGLETKWTEFPTTTRLGWRGPMIPLELIDQILIKF